MHNNDTNEMSFKFADFSDPEVREQFERYLRKITNQHTSACSRGDVEVIVKYKDGSETTKTVRNTVLRKGKIALANSLANEVSDPYDYYINKMMFGVNGTSGGTPKFVDEARTGLFGTTLISKNVISSIDPAAPTTAIFTSVIQFDEAVGQTINEMALQMRNGELYSMVTFPDIGKTSQMQLTFNWYITLL